MTHSHPHEAFTPGSGCSGISADRCHGRIDLPVVIRPPSITEPLPVATLELRAKGSVCQGATLTHNAVSTQKTVITDVYTTWPPNRHKASVGRDKCAR
ncbi:hypothetical protein E2C01_003803 [Portunus trituberculatus]|uniref:Uncharacterized protein n=1 Tax=Portunus trituberculatus TaxID=210409 RepID=A0A5B7CS60_PORTR|nr:hypothetical protein [Portunus trituberculatus]